MSNLAINLKPSGVFHEFGTVDEIGESIAVTTPAGCYAARRSASCLLQPESGDRVLLAVDTQGVAYVLAVLERAGGGTARLLVDGNLDLVAANGTIGISARDGIELTSAATIEATAGRFALGAAEAAVAVGAMRVTGSRLEVCVDTVRRIAGSLEEVIDNWTQHALRVIRRVAQVEQVKAGQIDLSADSTLSLSGENTLVTARKLVKVDADQIHLG